MNHKCEACGTIGAEKYVYVRTLNGGLNLCAMCLANINGKNPRLKALTDDTPVTEDWFRSIGATEDKRDDLVLGPMQWFNFAAGACISIDHHKGYFELKTRGQVRMVCAALGLTVNEKE